MDSAVRHLRNTQSQDATKAQFTLIRDSLKCFGGRQTCLQVVKSLCQQSAQSTSRPRRVVVLAFEQQPQRYAQLVRGAEQPCLHTLDCFSDPFGWLRSPGQTQAVAWRTGQDLANLRRAVDDEIGLPSQDKSQEAAACHVVIIDSLDHLLQHATLAQVLAFLQDLSSHAATLSICAKVHEDLHSPQVLAALTSLCSASLQLCPLHGLRKQWAMHNSPSKQAPHGELQLHLKRHTGRVKVETELYVLQICDMELFAPPAENMTAQLLAAEAVKAGMEAVAGQPRKSNGVDTETAAQEALLTQQAGMRLTLTDQERDARQAVVLPYEHQGSGRVYQTNNFRDYLPRSAGGQGKGAGEGALGHILYVRDSDSEHDSDEDPDDDLEI